MIIFYDSLTNLTKLFGEDLQKELEKSLGITILLKSVNDVEKEDISNQMYLLSRSIFFGEIPDTTLDFLDFLEDNDKLQNVLGVSVSGNLNWGTTYGKAGSEINKLYKIPYVSVFEGCGFPEDIDKVVKYTERMLKDEK